MPSPEMTLVDYFDDIEDIRLDRNKKHLLVDILVLAICGVICGANGPTEIVSVAKGKFEYLLNKSGYHSGGRPRVTKRQLVGASVNDLVQRRDLIGAGDAVVNVL